MDDFLLKLIPQLGIPGLSVFLLYRLLNTYSVKLVSAAAEFNRIQGEQAQSIAAIATLAQGHQDQQREVAMALRVVSKQMEGLGARFRELEERIGLGK